MVAQVRLECGRLHEESRRREPSVSTARRLASEDGAAGGPRVLSAW